MMSRLVARGVDALLISMIAIMVVLVFGNVVLRYAFNSGIVFSEEVSRFIFMWLTLIGALVVMKDHAHLGMTTIVNRLGETGQRVCRGISDLAALGCCLLLAHGAWKLMVLGMDDAAPVTGVPIGLVYACLLISSGGMAIILMHSLWRLLSGGIPTGELVPESGPTGE